MPFTIDEDTLLIKGRKGDTASFTFDFGQDISDYTVSFYVKKNITADPIIEKTYAIPSSTSVTIALTTTETEELSSHGSAYGIYYWGVKLTNGTSFAQTLIPQEFNNPPMMYIYPEIGG